MRIWHTFYNMLEQEKEFYRPTSLLIAYYDECLPVVVTDDLLSYLTVALQENNNGSFIGLNTLSHLACGATVKSPLPRI